MYQAYQGYASSGSSGLGLVALSTGIGFIFSLVMVARILYKVAALDRA